MIIKEFEDLCYVDESMEVQLSRKGLKLDPRVNFPRHVRFSIDYHEDGVTVTLTRLDDGCYDDDWDHDRDDDDDDVGCSFTMRIFDPQTETVPDFTSTVYVYYGLDYECAPSDTTLVIIHPSVKAIQDCAFSGCVKLRRVIMHQNVETIRYKAFGDCLSLDALFLPSSIKKIGDGAFLNCPNLRILSIPQTINIDQIGNLIINDCHTFFQITQIPLPPSHLPTSWYRANPVNRALRNFHRNLPPLHKACLNINVSTQSIRECIETHGIPAAYNTQYGDGMTPMHILALNPHAHASSIMTCFKSNMGAMFEPYSERGNRRYPSPLSNKTPLDYLAEYNVESHLSIVAALCRHREAYCSTSSPPPRG